MLILHVAMMLMHGQQPEPADQARRRKGEEEEMMSETEATESEDETDHEG